MIKNENTFNFSSHDTLILPQGLKDFPDVKSLFTFNKNTGILHKKINQNLINVEFYTQSHVIVFNISGIETITAYDCKSIKIEENELLFLPKDNYLISDFIKKNTQLEAYLFFLDEDIIETFLSKQKKETEGNKEETSFFKIASSPALKDYIKTLKSISSQMKSSKQFLEIKILELLYLIKSQDKHKKLQGFLSTNNNYKNKRNILSLMKKYYLNNFSIQDFATLSGRSLSSFHRDFKAVYKTTPNQFLVKIKMQHANTALEEENKTVSEIASDLGYENISHFIKAYKNIYHITPKQKQKNAL